MPSFQNNKTITWLVSLFFKLQFLFTAIRILLNVLDALGIYIANWSHWAVGMNNGILDVIFFISGLLYLSWYYIINVNYLQIVKSEKNLNAYWSVLFWLLPFVNIIAPYYRLRNIAVTYGNELSHQVMATKKLLIVWASTFALWYALVFYVFKVTPLFPEDLMLYYAQYPLLEFLHSNSRSMLELLGLAAMMAVVKNLATLEKIYIDGDEEVEITQHIIENP